MPYRREVPVRVPRDLLDPAGAATRVEAARAVGAVGACVGSSRSVGARTLDTAGQGLMPLGMNRIC